MAKTVVIDELHLTARIPADSSEEQVDAVRETLAGAEFMGRLLRAVRAAVRSHPELSSLRVSLSR